LSFYKVWAKHTRGFDSSFSSNRDKFGGSSILLFTSSKEFFVRKIYMLVSSWFVPSAVELYSPSKSRLMTDYSPYLFILVYVVSITKLFKSILYEHFSLQNDFLPERSSSNDGY
jgi:hypothetical protein